MLSFRTTKPEIIKKVKRRKGDDEMIMKYFKRSRETTAGYQKIKNMYSFFFRAGGRSLLVVMTLWLLVCHFSLKSQVPGGIQPHNKQLLT